MRANFILCALATLQCCGAWATTPAPAPVTALQLGKVDVTGLRGTVELLREMKTAVKVPFDDNPQHYDDMVCRIVSNTGFRAKGELLECGSQGWFGMRREAAQQDGIKGRADPDSVPARGRPWHAVRLLNYDQLSALRAVLQKLPPMGQGAVQVSTTPQPEKTP